MFEMSQILESAAGFLSFLAQHSYMNTGKTTLSILCFIFMSHYWGFIMYYEYIMQLLGSERLFTSFFPSFSHTSPLALSTAPCRNAQMGITGTLKLSTAKVKSLLYPC